MPRQAPASAPDACAVARGLRQDCELLARSLAALDGVPLDQVEDAFARHLAETRTLEQRITAAVEHLNAQRGGVERLPAPIRREMDLCIAEAGGLLQTAAGAYGGLAAGVAEALAAVRQRLDGIRQGGRMLRGYRQVAR